MVRKNVATIYDVAEAAGVSISTISRYLNSPSLVNLETGQKIKEVIETLAYVPHGNTGTRLARNTGRIGVLTPFFPAPSFVDRMHGMSPILHEAHCEMLVYSIDSPEQLDDYIHTGFFAKRLDGIIVMAMMLSDEQARQLHKRGVQVVLIEQQHQLFSSIACDNTRGGSIAAEYLLQKGYRRCAFIGQETALPYSLQPSQLRFAGFSTALQAAGFPLDPAMTLLGEVSVQGGYDMGFTLLERTNRPDAIFAMSDLQAFGVIKAARRLGLRIPQDIAVLGFDDVEAADYMELSTISQSLKESGRLATELLLGRIREPHRPVQHVQLGVSVVERSST